MLGQKVKIFMFDDGRQKFQHYPNQWKVTQTMFGGGKLELTNILQSEIIINSISSWKVMPLEKIEKKNILVLNPQDK